MLVQFFSCNPRVKFRRSLLNFEGGLTIHRYARSAVPGMGCIGYCLHGFLKIYLHFVSKPV